MTAVERQKDSRIAVLHLITGLDVGGAERNLSRVVRGLDPEKFRVRVLSLLPAGSVSDEIRDAGVQVSSVGVTGMRAVGSWLPRLVRELRSDRVDILHTWLYHADLAGTLLGPACGVSRLLWNIRCTYPVAPEDGPPSIVRVLARFSRRPDVILANSDSGRRTHESFGYHPRAWAVIPNGIDLQEYMPDPAMRREVRRELAIPEDAVVIAHVARMDGLKDHETMLRAARRVIAQRADVHFLFVGQGTDTSPVFPPDMAGPTIHRLGKRSDIARLLTAVDVNALSSIAEGFPTVLGEAMASGVPCVSTDVGDVRLLVGSTGAIVPPRDDAALATALIGMVSDAGRRAALGRAARQRIADLYSIESVVSRHEDLYTAMVNAG